MTVAVPRRLSIFISVLFLTATPLLAAEKIVAYVPNWVDLKSFAETIEYGKLTHINIAFENPINEQGELSFHKKNEILIARAHAAGVKVLVSIGGGAASGNKTLKARYFDLLSEPKRANFAAKLAAYVADHQFDGLDVDIEGPSINQDYGAFIDELSTALKPKGKLLTAALSQGYGGKSVPDSVLAQFDFVSVMAYDGKGSWNPNAPGQHSSMEFAKRNIDYWLKRGLPASKTVLGLPFYGYGFGKSFRKGTYSYSEIVAAYPDAAKKDQIGDTIWYNGVPTIEAKTNYAIDRGLAGVMIWSLDNDVKGEKSLLDAIVRTYRSRRAEDPPAPVEDRVGFPSATSRKATSSASTSCAVKESSGKLTARTGPATGNMSSTAPTALTSLRRGSRSRAQSVTSEPAAIVTSCTAPGYSRSERTRPRQFQRRLAVRPHVQLDKPCGAALANNL
jgi:chitinase